MARVCTETLGVGGGIDGPGGNGDAPIAGMAAACKLALNDVAMGKRDLSSVRNSIHDWKVCLTHISQSSVEDRASVVAQSDGLKVKLYGKIFI